MLRVPALAAPRSATRNTRSRLSAAFEAGVPISPPGRGAVVLLKIAGQIALAWNSDVVPNMRAWCQARKVPAIKLGSPRAVEFNEQII